MLEKKAINEVADILTVDSFYVDAHARIYGACIALNKRGNPIDILTVVNELKSRAELEIVGGAYYVSTLTNRVVGSHNIEYHSRIIQQKYIQRELIRLSTETIRDCFEDSCDPLDAIDIHEKGLTQISLGISKGKEAQTVADVWHELEEKNTALLKRDGVIGVPSGLTEIDKLTGGWQKTDLIIIAARPAMGKTALALCMARNAALDFKKPTLVFSLEMSTSQLVTRLVASETREYIKNFTRSGIEPSKFFEHQNTCSRLIDSPLYIDDTPSLTLTELRAKARRMARLHKIELIVIDYIQLMSGEGAKGNRENEISTISRGLKSLAKELNIPIIVLSQLNRQVESRAGDKRPQLSDLRESGAIEQDADIVGFLHRPEYYGINEYEGGRSTKGVAEFIIKKHRNGDIDTAEIAFINRLTRFEDLPMESNNQVELTDYTESKAIINSQGKGADGEPPF
jgi:replicative DNA helicase